MWIIYCEPTYEELKRSMLAPETSEAIDCEPTYEELKPATSLALSTGVFNCEPTYEELKREFTIGNAVKYKLIASLPMRN